MSDCNIVDFGKAKDESASENAPSIEERVLKCMENQDCKCMYCTYRENASEMLIDFLASDIVNFENNTKARLCTYDMKEILFAAINKIKEMEREPNGSEEI